MNIQKIVADKVRQMSDKEIFRIMESAGGSVVFTMPGGAIKLEGATNGNGAAAKAAPKAAPKAKAVKTPKAKVEDVPKAARLPRGELDAKVLAHLAAHDKLGFSSKDISIACGAGRGPVATVIQNLKKAGKLFQGGNRRFARYATTQKVADDASLSLRSK